MCILKSFVGQKKSLSSENIQKKLRILTQILENPPRGEGRFFQNAIKLYNILLSTKQGTDKICKKHARRFRVERKTTFFILRVFGHFRCSTDDIFSVRIPINPFNLHIKRESIHWAQNPVKYKKTLQWQKMLLQLKTRHKKCAPLKKFNIYTFVKSSVFPSWWTEKS